MSVTSLPIYAMTDEDLIAEIEQQRNIMIAVATGGPRILDVNDEYVQRRSRVAAELGKRRIPDPNPHRDLWQWYGTWSAGEMPTWQSRRVHVSKIFDVLVDRLTGVSEATDTVRIDEPTGWPRVDRVIEEIRLRLEQGENEEHFQAVGLLCREVLISVGQIVYDPQCHPSTDGTKPSLTDAKRMLDCYFMAELGGHPNEGVRRHAKAALALANDLQHRRTADRRQAALCAEAMVSVINIVSIVSGRRNRDGGQIGVVRSIADVEGLGPHHIAVLVAVAREIDEPSDSIPVHRIRRITEQDGFTKVATTLGLNALLEKSMVFAREQEDDDGSRYKEYGLTERGMGWLVDNEDKIVLKHEPQRWLDDNVPF